MRQQEGDQAGQEAALGPQQGHVADQDRHPLAEAPGFAGPRFGRVPVAEAAVDRRSAPGGAASGAGTDAGAYPVAPTNSVAAPRSSRDGSVLRTGFR